MIVSSSLDGKITLWDYVKRKEENFLKESQSGTFIYCLSLIYETNLIAFGTQKNLVKIWDYKTGLVY